MKKILFVIISVVFFACSDYQAEWNDLYGESYTQDLSMPVCTETRTGDTIIVAKTDSSYICQNNTWVPIVESLEALLNCTDKRLGEIAFVLEENYTYKCNNNKWVVIIPPITMVGTLDDLLNCSKKREGDSAFVTDKNAKYRCESGRWKQYETSNSSSVKVESSSSSSSVKIESSSSQKIVLSSSSKVSVTVEVTNGNMTDTRDGRIYKTVTIASQTWMAENLNYNVSGSSCYNSSPSNCETYGRLYSQDIALEACPTGWHLPSSTEWRILLDNVTPSSSLLAKNNSSGFAALLAGSSKNAPGYYAIFWTSDKDVSANIGTSFNGVYSIISGELIYVRCLKD